MSPLGIPLQLPISSHLTRYKDTDGQSVDEDLKIGKIRDIENVGDIGYFKIVVGWKRLYRSVCGEKDL